MFGTALSAGTFLAATIGTSPAALTIAAAALLVYDLSEYRRSSIEEIGTLAEVLGLASAPAQDGLASGSVINFVIAERRVRFEVALPQAAVRSLAIGSGLLSVAIKVLKDSLLLGDPPAQIAASSEV